MVTASAQRVETLFASVYHGDIATVLACLHPDIIIHEADGLPYGGSFQGHDGFLELQTMMLSKMDIRIKSHRLISNDEQVAGHVQVEFTVRTTGRSIVMPVVEIYDFTDELISSIDVYYKDVAAINTLLGD
jgi:uncharacterized protein